MNSLQGPKRSILSVVGPHSGCGKTLFISLLVKEINGLGCLKVSPSRDWAAPAAHTAVTGGENFYLEDSTPRHRPAADTSMYLAAGAAQAMRLIYRRDGLGAGLTAALACYPPNMPIVVESAAAAAMLRPMAVVLVVRHPPREMKPTTAAILSQVTDLMINAPQHHSPTDEAAEQLKQRFPMLCPQFTWSADLLSGPLPAQMLHRLRSLLIMRML
ncbi:MAG: hypothetical protein KAV82_10480 [Phycisphaerae bacterium]|nr:hypothetical protein [Phycisphaerae bacterium]